MNKDHLLTIVYIFSVVAIALMFAACSAQAPAPQAPPVFLSDTPRPALVFTITPPGTTDISTPSTSPYPTQSPVPSNTPLPTQDLTLSAVKLIGLAWYDNYDLLLSFQFPEAVHPDRYWVTLEDKLYQCETLARFPDRLYCRGQGAKVLGVATIRLYADGSTTPGYEKEVWVPYFNNNYDMYNP